MRFPNLVRPLIDDEVDRSGVEVPQGMELTDTNRPRAYPKKVPLKRKLKGMRCSTQTLLVSDLVFRVQSLKYY